MKQKKLITFFVLNSRLFRVTLLSQKGCVVQLDRISDFGSEGWGFESLRGHHRGQIIFFGLSFSFAPL